MKITRLRLYAMTTTVWAIWIALSWTRSNPLQLLNILGFGSLCIIPGLLTVQALRLGRHLPFWYRLGQIIGFSLLGILAWTLLSNTILPYVHVLRPLDPKPLRVELSVFYVILAFWSWWRLRGFSYTINRKQLVRSRLDGAMLAGSGLLVLLAVTGAISLNNNGTDALTLLMLSAAAVYCGLLLVWRRRLHNNTFCWAIYMLSLSLLLMTSLRGWYVTGHDIQHEFQVFQLAQSHGRWSIADQADPYNACLSITILPTVFANLLRIGDPYVFKVLFQLLFATVPALLYLLMRRYLTAAKALLAVLYFVAFPTFFTDMPFLNRQEMAFLFLALMLLVIFDTRIALLKRQWLFIIFGVGVILSHYSTTYALLSILLLMAVALPLFNWLAPGLSRKRLFSRSNIEVLNGLHVKAKPVITIAVVVMLAYLGFVWNTVLTHTSTAATGVISQTISAITTGFGADVRSSDVSYSLLAPANASPQQTLRAYNRLVVNPQRKSAPPGTFYANTTALPQAITQDNAPLTSLGRKLQAAGLNVSAFNYTLKQSAAKLLQVFVLIGLAYTFFRKRQTRPIEAQYLLLTLASLVFVMLQVVLPDLSAAYGLLRAFQQALMLLGLFLVIGTCVLAQAFRNQWLSRVIPAAIALLFFLASTGVIPQLLGGYQSQLQLNNSGQYYDVYYTHIQELAAANWLNKLAAQTVKHPRQKLQLQTDQFMIGKLSAYASPKLDIEAQIYPGLVRQDAYVLLGYQNVVKQQTTLSYNGDMITYQYPLQTLSQDKNLVYSNGSTEVYK